MTVPHIVTQSSIWTKIVSSSVNAMQAVPLYISEMAPASMRGESLLHMYSKAS